MAANSPLQPLTSGLFSQKGASSRPNPYAFGGSPTWGMSRTSATQTAMSLVRGAMQYAPPILSYLNQRGGYFAATHPGTGGGAPAPDGGGAAGGTPTGGTGYFGDHSSFAKYFNPNVIGWERVAADRLQQLTMDGRNVLAFTVKPGDVQTWDAKNVGPGGKPNTRAEVSYTYGPGDQKVNSPYNVTGSTGRQIYDIGLNFANGFPTDQRWATMLQFHPQDDRNSDGWAFSGISLHGNSIDVLRPFTGAGPNGGTDQYIARIPIVTGQWNDMRLDVNWSTGSAGYVKVYNNGKLVGSYAGPTAKPGVFYYLKQGYYRDGAINQNGTVYQTPLAIGY